MSHLLLLEQVDESPSATFSVVAEISSRITRLDCQRVQRSSYKEVRALSCDFRDGRLYLHGEVSTFYLKQMAQEAVRTIEGARVIISGIHVVYPKEPNLNY